MAKNNTYDKEYALTKMEEILNSRLELTKLDYYNVSDLARRLGVSTNALYDLWYTKVGTKWIDMMPLEVTVRPRRKLRRITPITSKRV